MARRGKKKKRGSKKRAKKASRTEAPSASTSKEEGFTRLLGSEQAQLVADLAAEATASRPGEPEADDTPERLADEAERAIASAVEEPVAREAEHGSDAEEPAGEEPDGVASEGGDEASLEAAAPEAHPADPDADTGPAEEARVAESAGPVPAEVPAPVAEAVDPLYDLDAAVEGPESSEGVGELAALVAEASDDSTRQEAPPPPGDVEEEAAPSAPAAATAPAVAMPVPAAEAPDDDVGAPSTPEARARLLAETLAHAEMQEARYRVPTDSRRTSRIKGTVALFVFSVAGFLWLSPPGFVVPDPPLTLAAGDRAQGVRVALLLQAEQIEAFRARANRLPRTLDEVPVRLSGVRYVRSSERLYQLIGYTPAGEAIVYDSSAPAPAFASLAAPWRGGEGS